MRERAIQALAAEGVPARVQAVEEHRRTADAIERRLDEVEQRIPWLDRVNFFSDTPDEELAHALRSQVVEARARLHAAQREADVAIDQALQGLPPLRIALLVERCVEKGRRSPELGIVTDEAAEAFATELLGLDEAQTLVRRLRR